MLWRQAAVRTSLSVVLIVGAILGAGLYVLPQYLRFVQDYSATRPRLGAPLTMAAGLVMMLGTCVAMVHIWTPTTPTTILAPAIFMQGFSLGAVLLGAARVAIGAAALPDLNDMSTTYFFVRQLGNTLGVTAVTVLFDRRMSLHSARLLDVANRLDPTVRSTLAQYANLIHRNGGGSNPALGALQLFQASVVTQSRLLSYVDVYFGSGALAAFALVLIGLKKLEYNAAGPAHFHLP
jgi:MFS transporter, DHA2 family, multidrug resistance protein